MPMFADSRRVAAFALSASLCLLLSGGTANARATYTTFDTGGLVQSMNSTGTVVGWKYDGNSFIRSVDGTITTFAVPGAAGTRAVSINDGGAIAGIYDDGSSHSLSFVRAADGSIRKFGVQDAPIAAASWINNRGDVAGYYSYNGGYNRHGFVRAAGGKITTFDVPNGATTPASINDRGAITGLYEDGAGAHGFVRTRDGSIATFDVPGATYTFAFGINIRGTVAGSFYTVDTTDAFVRTADGTITTFGLSVCGYIYWVAIDSRGVVTGGCNNVAQPSEVLGFIRYANGKIGTFHVPHMGRRTFPCCINDNGVIAGNLDIDNTYHGFLRFPSLSGPGN